ncbi:MAG: YggS family pyridoxal phosphate-dependent enzyme [Thermodesulfobacteriota bacterium]|nr:YggS family pyridoxal phosphate-dependent enzyme [Thermodesulfobacteriota bacterium]
MAETMEDRLKGVTDQISTAAVRSGRDPSSVRLVTVSKTIPAEHVLAAIQAGVTDLGENYVQEAQQKIDALRDQNVSWHFIGHLQTNKAKYAVNLFDLIHSVDSVKLARELNKRSANLGKVQKVLVQVNISGERTKSGVETDMAIDLVGQMAHFENLTVRGLMTMPPYFNAPEKVRPYFKALRRLQAQIRKERFPNVHMAELSMGMTGDFEAAIEEGATLVRIGTAIFGKRA